MRKILLATTAAAALIAGTSIGMAQQVQGGAGGSMSGNAGVSSGGKQGGGSAVQHSQQGTSQRMGQSSPGSRGTGREERGERGMNGVENGQRGMNARGQGNDRDLRGDRTNRGDRDLRGDRTNRGDRDLRGERNNRGDRDLHGQRGEFREGTGGRELRGQATEGRGSVSLSSDQRTRIHSLLFSGGRAHRLGSADFDVRVGARVPRTIEFFDLPPDVVEIVPAFRHYKYVLIGDEIVIIDPVTYEIVDVIPA